MLGRAIVFIWCIVLVRSDGCPEYCACSDNERSADCNIYALSNVKRPVDLDEVKFVSSQPLVLTSTIFKHFRSVKVLNLSYMKIRTVPTDSFHGMKYLTEIDLSYNRIKRVNGSSYKNLKSLKTLRLRGNPLQLTLSDVIVSKSLEELDLGQCSLTDLKPGVFKQVPSLTDLSLDGNLLTTLENSLFPKGLRFLNLARNKISIVPTKVLVSLHNLAEVDVSENPINCTCSLLLMDDLFAGEGKLLLHNATCFSPPRYEGKRLHELYENNVCRSELMPDTNTNSILRSTKDRSWQSLMQGGDFADFQADQPPRESDSGETQSNESQNNKIQGGHLGLHDPDKTENDDYDEGTYTTAHDYDGHEQWTGSDEGEGSGEGYYNPKFPHFEETEDQASSTKKYLDFTEGWEIRVESSTEPSPSVNIETSSTEPTSSVSVETSSTGSTSLAEEISPSTEETTSAAVEMSSSTETISSSSIDTSSSAETSSVAVEMTSSTEETSSATAETYSSTETSTLAAVEMSSSTEETSSATVEISSSPEASTLGSVQTSSSTEQASSPAVKTSSSTEQTSSSDVEMSSTTEETSSAGVVQVETQGTTPTDSNYFSQWDSDETTEASTEAVLVVEPEFKKTVELPNENEVFIETKEGFSKEEKREDKGLEMYAIYAITALIVAVILLLVLVSVCRRKRGKSYKVSLPADPEANSATEMQDMLLPKPPENGIKVVPKNYSNGNTANGKSEQKEEERPVLAEPERDPENDWEDKVGPIEAVTARMCVLARPQTPIYIHKSLN